jgi:predicted amidohydrolase YtcJ
LLIRDAEIAGRHADLRTERDLIAEIGTGLRHQEGETVIDARGAALLPGLHDHHIHLLSLAKALTSVPCGPPAVAGAAQLTAALRAATADDDGWIRGIGYHESVAGDIDRHWLDEVRADLPMRIQHRSGRLWLLNSTAVERLGVARTGNGRHYDADGWLRSRLPQTPPSLQGVSRLLAGWGVTGVTDATPHNGRREFEHFVAEQARGHLMQNVLVLGGSELVEFGSVSRVRPGATKLHLHESALPDFDDICTLIADSHRAGRPVAIHCVTVAELVFAVSALTAAGGIVGDRIEHASVAPPDALTLLSRQGLTVVTQPNFIFERGDAYRASVQPEDQPWLYRGRGFLDAGIGLAAGTDAPFGAANPWLAMDAAVRRRSRDGHVLGGSEALSPEEALGLFLGSPDRPGGSARALTPGAVADLCLLDRPWAEARRNLADVRVHVTIVAGARCDTYSALGLQGGD